MAATIAHRALEIVKERTTANLAREIYGSSFALDEAMRLCPEARSAAITLADSGLALDSPEEITRALYFFGYRASAHAAHLDGIRAYAANRRRTS